MTLNNAESLSTQILRKFLSFSKDSEITMVYTVNKVLRPSTLDVLSEFDYKEKLDYFQYKELYHILEQRAYLGFKQGLDKDLIEYIADLVFEYHVPVPGKGIEIFRDLYPILKDRRNAEPFEVFNTFRNHFNGITVDELSMLEYFSDQNILTLIFLDNISNFFMNNSNFYISTEELKELYDLSCESLEYDKNVNEFNEITKMLYGIGILSTSKKNDGSTFISINKDQLKMIIDSIF